MYTMSIPFKSKTENYFDAANINDMTFFKWDILWLPGKNRNSNRRVLKTSGSAEKPVFTYIIKWIRLDWIGLDCSLMSFSAHSMTI